MAHKIAYIPEEEARERRKYLQSKEDVVEKQKRQQQHPHACLPSKQSTPEKAQPQGKRKGGGWTALADWFKYY